MPTVPKDDSRVPMTPNQTVGEDFKTMAYGLMRRSQEVEDFTGWKGYLSDVLPQESKPQGEQSGTPLAKAAGEDALISGKSEALGMMRPKAQADAGASPQFFSGSSDATWKSIFQQESSSGKDLRTSVAGARGPGQIMPGTFKQWARPGESIDNYNDNIAVSKRMVESYHKQYGGDPARVAVAYYSGPGNVAPPGSPTPWKSDIKKNGPAVSQYVQQVIGRMGGNVDISGVPQARSRASGGSDWDKIGRYVGSSDETPRFKPDTSWLDAIVNARRGRRKA